MISLKESRKDRLKLKHQLDILSMPAAERKRLVRSIGNQVRSDARANIRNQATVTGSKMAPRKNARNKRKLLRRMGKGMTVKVWSDSRARASVSWKNAGVAQVAYKQQEGIADTFTPAKMKALKKKFEGPGYYRKPATKAQAKSLNQAGFKRRVARKKGKGKASLKRVPQKWITENMTIGQAGLVLRLMRTNTKKGMQSWKVKPAPRKFLGATKEDADKYLTKMAQDAITKIKR